MVNHKPLWKREEQANEDELEKFAIELENRQTMLHIHNDDAYNILNDKTIQLHKISKRKNEWIYDPIQNPDNPHEKRFELLPYNGLPSVHSKVRKS